MTKKTWHVWIAFGFCLAIVWLAMAWLTVRVVALDRAEAAARREAERARRRSELQERIATALWRMDAALTPLIAQEAARPSFLYQSFLRPAGGGGNKTVERPVASPLLVAPPDHVVVNFEVTPDNHWNSPQVPDPAKKPEGISRGISKRVLRRNQDKLNELRESVTFGQLLALLPEALLPRISDEYLGQGTFRGEFQERYAVGNQYGQQQMESSQRTTSASAQRPPSTRSRPEPAQPSQTEREAQPGGLRQQALQPAPQQQSLGPSTPALSSREQQEWQRRDRGMQNVVRSQRAQIASNSAFMTPAAGEREGVSRAVWIDNKLLLARRVISNRAVRIQGCWLDWPAIKEHLQAEVADLFPRLELLPVTTGQDVPPGRLLAALPVQLVVPQSALPPPRAGHRTGTGRGSVIRVSLVIAWCCLLLGSLAVAIMLWGVLALSERRAAFVSAVTHELRSPLTTFRMYAEMLSESMVRDEAQRQRYLATLRQEADRLGHLVDNVLQYARLERGRRPRQRIELTLKLLMQQATERSVQRAREAGMELHETLTPQDAAVKVLTDPGAVEQILFNLVDNSCKYASQATDRRIHVHWSVGRQAAQVRVTDHGPGIEEQQAKKLFHPFRKSDQEAAQSAPGIGLGLALCRRLAHEIGGRLHFDPGDGRGAAFLLELPLA